GTVIDLDQLADRFTEPDLLPRMLGFTDTPIQDVSNASPVRLYPRIEFFDPQPVGSAARVRAINCGGGIGRTVVYLNNTEVISDARSSASEADASEMTLDIDVSASPVLNRDGRNLAAIKAYNTDESLVSRALTWSFGGTTHIESGATPE